MEQKAEEVLGTFSIASNGLDSEIVNGTVGNSSFDAKDKQKDSVDNSVTSGSDAVSSNNSANVNKRWNSESSFEAQHPITPPRWDSGVMIGYENLEAKDNQSSSTSQDHQELSNLPLQSSESNNPNVENFGQLPLVSQRLDSEFLEAEENQSSSSSQDQEDFSNFFVPSISRI